MSRRTMRAGSEPETGPCLPRLQSQSQSEALRVTAACAGDTVMRSRQMGPCCHAALILVGGTGCRPSRNKQIKKGGMSHSDEENKTE